MFDPQAVGRIVHLARANGIDPAALLAVAEVESAGRPLEQDGVTPRFLFERHVFYRALYKADKAKLKQAVAQGLAIPKWDRKTQYRDQGNSTGRMASLRAARAIDEECANRACSWGLGQILGENAVSLGYADATDMVDQLVAGGVPAQVEAMLRFVRKNNLVEKLNLHDWAGFALKYNGPGYAQNRYDVKMAAAYQKWAAKLDAQMLPPPEPEGPEGDVPLPPPDETVDDLPPPYVEPKTPAKSKTLWSVLGQILSALGAGAAYMLSDWRIMLALVVAIIFLALFIGRERIRKIVDEHV
jgi:hypothetical protein